MALGANPFGVSASTHLQGMLALEKQTIGNATGFALAPLMTCGDDRAVMTVR